MRVSREQVTANRERIVANAAEQFRRRGFGDVTIADVMKAAGLTHGGFYGYFDSKQALEAAVCERGLAESVAAVSAVRGAEGDGDGDGTAAVEAPLRRFVDDYLSARHRDAPEEGCTVAALACDAGRSGPDLQRLFVSGVTGMADSLAGLRQANSPEPAGDPGPDFATLSTMVGAVILSRAVAAADPELSERILAAARERAAAPGE
ncbi:TetR/AcrR family transcriptional regulator [Streptomyces sp. NPDC088733]|uniref:TetR/AcrR family transcriptional regulator n=1 Tax=Streptomyces sp. NPDC088733 TaxID=3365880 RepID=UPI00380C8478